MHLRSGQAQGWARSGRCTPPVPVRPSPLSRAWAPLPRGKPLPGEAPLHPWLSNRSGQLPFTQRPRSKRTDAAAGLFLTPTVVQATS